MAYAYGTTINPGSMITKTETTPGTSSLLDKINVWINRLITVTVLRERPPVGSMRPSVSHYGGPFRNEIRNVSEIDLSRVPTVTMSSGLPSDDTWITHQLRRPAPPMGDGTASSRALYPGAQASSYHQPKRQDLAWPCVFAMASNMEMSLRKEFARVAVQQWIDRCGSDWCRLHRPGSEGRRSPPYNWSAPGIWAGTVLRDARMAGWQRYFEVASPDYSILKGLSFSSVDDLLNATPNSGRAGATDDLDGGRLRRDVTDAGTATRWSGAGGTDEVWDALLSQRVLNSSSSEVDFPYTPANYSREFARLERLVGTGNVQGNGTQITQVTIPANRSITGMEYLWQIQGWMGTQSDKIGEVDIMMCRPGDGSELGVERH